jgi:hypothetical protein
MKKILLAVASIILATAGFFVWNMHERSIFVNENAPIVDSASSTESNSALSSIPEVEPAAATVAHETIVGTSIQKQGVVIVPDIYAAVPETKGWLLYDVAYSTAKNKLFFGLGNEGDGPMHQLYSFNTITRAFTKLTNSYQAIDGWRGPQKNSISPDGFRFLSIHGGELYLVDMDADSVRLLKTLPMRETFVKTIQNFGGIDEGENEWISNSEIKFSIFKAVADENGNHTFLRTETLALQQSAWTLISGDSKDICTTPTFAGEVRVRGWYEETPTYGDGKEEELHVYPDDIPLLPGKQLGIDYSKIPFIRIDNASSTLVDMLRNADAANPAYVTLAQFKQYCEGGPMVLVK